MRIEVNDQSPKYARVISRRFCCKVCGYFCIEWTPILRRGMRAYFDRKKDRSLLPKVRLECPHGHHKHRAWSFVDMHNLKGGGKR